MNTTTDYLIKLYNKHYQKYGMTKEGLGWGKKDRSDIRFEILTSSFHLDDASILDVGSGFGDLFEFLTQKKVKNFSYTGLDINPTFATLSQKKFPKGSFLTGDILDRKLTKKFDYVFASGIFNDKIPGAKERTAKILTAINSHAKKGFAVNFLSDAVDFRLPHTNHTNPGWAVNLSLTFSKNIVLRNDYMPFEFTIIVNKQEKFRKQNAIFETYVEVHA